MFGILLILFTVVPALEFYLLFKLGSHIGAIPTFLIIITTGIAGAFLSKTQGLAIISKIQTELNNNQIPAKEILHGFLIFGGGLLLLTPGFLTDLLGFLMVIPGSRHLLASYLIVLLKTKLKDGTFKFSTFSANNSHHEMENNVPINEKDGDIIEAEYKKKN